MAAAVAGRGASTALYAAAGALLLSSSDARAALAGALGAAAGALGGGARDGGAAAGGAAARAAGGSGAADVLSAPLGSPSGALLTAGALAAGAGIASMKVEEWMWVSKRVFRAAMTSCRQAVDALRGHVEAARKELTEQVETSRRETLARVDEAERRISDGVDELRDAEERAAAERAELRSGVEGVRAVVDESAQELAEVKQMVEAAQGTVMQVWEKVHSVPSASRAPAVAPPTAPARARAPAAVVSVAPASPKHRHAEPTDGTDDASPQLQRPQQPLSQSQAGSSAPSPQSLSRLQVLLDAMRSFEQA